MASQTYQTQGIVLKKTKLGESDLIITMLAQDGSQIRFVAKGARKPTNTFAVRLELYSVSEILAARGRNLDVVTEVRLLESNSNLRREVAYAAGAAPLVELLDKVTQRGLENPKLFEMAQVALRSLGQSNSRSILTLSASHLLKTVSLCGLRPCLTTCVLCGSSLASLLQSGTNIHLSYREGGVLCDQCGAHHETLLVSSSCIRWAHYLITTPFDTIGKTPLTKEDARQVLHFCQGWIREHLGISLKALSFMLSTDLWE